MASVDELKAKTAEALKLYDRLRLRGQVAQRAGLSNEYSDIVSRFSTVKAALQKLTDTGSLTEAVKVMWNGSQQPPTVSTSRSDGFVTPGMGVLPVIAWWAGGTVAVSGAVALVSYWIADAVKLDNRLTAYEKALAAGTPPAQAAKDVATASGDYAPDRGPGFKLDLSGLALPAVVLLAVIYGPRILDAWKKQRRGK